MELINRVFLILGNDCNLQCRYCAQHPISRMTPRQHVSENLIKWLESTAGKNPKGLRVTFYGGEPLLYFHELKEVVERTDGNIRWSIITNAKALTDNMVDFFNAHSVHVAVSWDGPNVLRARGFDAFDPLEPLRRRILRIESLCLTGVVSRYALPMEIMTGMQELADQHRALIGNEVSANLDLIFDSGIPDHKMTAISSAALAADAREMCRIYFDGSIPYKKKSCIVSYIDARIEEVHRVLKHGHPVRSRCGNGYTVFNVDLAGNLYSCHNNRDKCGEIGGDAAAYYSKIITGDAVIRRRKNRCQECAAYLMCDGGCKMVGDEALDSYCEARRAFFGTILECIEEQGGAV